MPTPAMLAWARELQVGSWYMLDYRSRNEPVQLAWQGMRRQLTLFVSPQGRGVLFQQNRLAAFLQAGLLVPAQDESLTVKATRATRSAMEKLEAAKWAEFRSAWAELTPAAGRAALRAAHKGSMSTLQDSELTDRRFRRTSQTATRSPLVNSSSESSGLPRRRRVRQGSAHRALHPGSRRPSAR